ncbi:MAG: hypothetical protein IJ911_08360 [Salinivirgaceae bacterium]|nr:hypothetical protein [Salinivirgaceae bacterium]
MGKLFDALTNFVKDVDSNIEVEKLEEKFNELARVFLYGGYIKVRNDYRVYIRTVEFYFHSEKDGIHDPIVYHRNNRYIEGEVPYFPTMFLHAHASGFDITFEKEGKYRASALIRSYVVKEAKDNDAKYLIWDKEKEMFVKSEKYGYNTQSTYLYTLLNGFPICVVDKDNMITWVDDFQGKQMKDCKVKPNPRQNVPLFRTENGKFEKVTKEYYENHIDEFREKIVEPKFLTYDKIKYLQDYRLWQFERDN